MQKQRPGFFMRNFFDKELPFEYRIYMIFFMESYVISILSATTNTMLQKGLFGIILQWSYILLCTVILFIPLKARMRLSKPMLIFTALFYIPFLFFQTAGYDGTALLFALLGIFLLAIVFKGRQRVLLIAANILIYVGVCVTQYLNPTLIIPHATEMDKLVDLLVALVLSTTGMAILTVYVSNAYEIERTRIQNLLVELEKNNRALAEMTNRDALTGAYNRRFLTQFLDKELETTYRTHSFICLLMLDLDHFKDINDSYGHGFGDEALVACAKTIQDSLRKYDVLARFGGEEFVVILHAISLEDAKVIAERIRLAVSGIKLRNEISLTVSIGLVASRPGESSDVLIARADACLYEAKNKGRNRVAAEKTK